MGGGWKEGKETASRMRNTMALTDDNGLRRLSSVGLEKGHTRFQSGLAEPPLLHPTLSGTHAM